MGWYHINTTINTVSEITVFIRRSFEGELTKDTFYSHFFVGLPFKIAQWNRLLTVDFHDFRNELFKITQYNLSRLSSEGVSIQYYIKPSIFEDYKKNFPDGWVIPLDDDDWLPPNLLPALRAVEDKSKLVCWNTLIRRPYELYPDGTFIPKRVSKTIPGSSYVCHSCSYAINATSPLYNYGIISNHWYTKNVAPVERTLLDLNSVYLLSPSSAWFLAKYINSPFMIPRAVMMFKENLPDYTEEFAEERRMLEELFSKIDLKDEFKKGLSKNKEKKEL